VREVALTPASATLIKDGTVQLRADVRDGEGNLVTSRPVTWSSSDESVAIVDSAGLVAGLGAGTTTIRASSDGVDGTAEITVEELSFALIGSGFTHSCGLTTDGRVYCWGSNGEGKLGDGTDEPSLLPSPVAADIELTLLSVGFAHSCAIAQTGSAYCWGSGAFGKLGNADEISRRSPVAVAGGLSFAAISAGRDHTCGITTSGDAYCWGLNEDGQLGSTTSQLCSDPNGGTPLPCATAPVAVSGGHTFESIDAGLAHTCGIRPDAAAYCWGSNQWGELGIGADVPPSSVTPLAVAWPAGFAQIVASYHGYTCGVGLGDGLGYCWGNNDLGQLGRGTISGEEHDVAAVPAGTTFLSMQAAIFHTCGLATDGTAYCWGQNPFGLGHGGTTPSELPVQVASGLRFVNLATGWYRTCGVASDGIAYCWGNDPLGNGSPDPSATPVRVSGQPESPYKTAYGKRRSGARRMSP
jgi:alpha-tubulin suppressor-like RCC1 family protein